jgi:hypothetical protein
MAFNVKESLDFIKAHEEYLRVAEDLFNIYNRRISPYIKKRIDIDFQGTSTRTEAKTRISAINVLPKIVNKLSNVYKTQVIRTPDNGVGEENITRIMTAWKMDQALANANKMLNLFRCVALEPIMQTNSIRVLPAHRFLVMGDGTIDNVMTQFIKIIGTKSLGSVSSVTEYEAYTTEEFVRFDSNGTVTQQIPNEFGVIPVIYATRDCVTLMPDVDDDTINMVTLLPLLLTDLNFAMKYQCFSIIYTMNLEAKNLTVAPNAMWNFKSDGADGDKGELGMLNPTVRAADMLDTIKAQYSIWLEERGIKISALEKASMDNLSGIAKAIDQADVTEDLKYQRGIFKDIERELFSTIGKLATPNIDLLVSTSFHEETLVEETATEKVDRIIKKLDAQLMSWERALKEANSHMTDADIETMKAEIIKAKALKETLERKADNGMGTGSNAGSASQIEVPEGLFGTSGTGDNSNDPSED